MTLCATTAFVAKDTAFCPAVSHQVSLFAVGNGLGRLAVGQLSDWTHRRRLVPRPLWLCGSMLLMAAAHTVLALPFGLPGLYCGMFCVGLSFGAMFTLNVVITSELWGVTNHGANYMLFDGTTGIFGTLCLGKYLTQAVYVAGIEAGQPDSRDCHGRQCFANTHWIVAGACAASTLACLTVAWRTRTLYKRIWRGEDLDIPAWP